MLINDVIMMCRGNHVVANLHTLKYISCIISDTEPCAVEHDLKLNTQMSPRPATTSHSDSMDTGYYNMIKKTNSVLYHGPVWITLNSFIWNIKTMKHKPSTKSDSYKCRIIRLLKWTGYTGKQLFFFLFEWWSRYTEQTVKCEHDYAIYTLQILPDSRGEKEKKRKKKRGGKKARKSRRKNWNRYSSDDSLVSLWQWLRPRI